MTVAGGLEFLDANVLVYAYDVAATDKKQRAIDLVARLVADEAGAVSMQTLQEFYVITTRKIPRPLTPEQARDRIAMFGRMAVHSPTVSHLIEASLLGERAQLSLWDAMIVTSARALGCAVLWTEDLNHGQVIDGVQIRNPFAASS